MREWQSQSHVKWECKYHVVFIPKYRKKEIYGKVRRQIGRIFRELCCQKEMEILEGHALGDHVHMIISAPPKYSPAFIVGYLKGKCAIRIHRDVIKGKTGKHFWARGYCVSTVGLDERTIREYVRNQEKMDSEEQYDFFK